uniref:hypothetical protein n=1 Tax=Streptococcus equi TaxID=1336 RepID=UPI003969D134
MRINFNPLARMGRDSTKENLVLYFFVFQSTRPYGARQSSLRLQLLLKYFNPLARMGRDKPVGETPKLEQEFQSTRPYGARRCSNAISVRICRFQSTRPYGARHSL